MKSTNLQPIKPKILQKWNSSIQVHVSSQPWRISGKGRTVGLKSSPPSKRSMSKVKTFLTFLIGHNVRLIQEHTYRKSNCKRASNLETKSVIEPHLVVIRFWSESMPLIEVARFASSQYPSRLISMIHKCAHVH